MSVDKIRARIEELGAEMAAAEDSPDGRISRTIKQARREGVIEAWEMVTGEKWPTRPEDPARAI